MSEEWKQFLVRLREKRRGKVFRIDHCESKRITFLLKCDSEEKLTPNGRKVLHRLWKRFQKRRKEEVEPIPGLIQFRAIRKMASIEYTNMLFRLMTEKVVSPFWDGSNPETANMLMAVNWSKRKVPFFELDHHQWDEE